MNVTVKTSVKETLEEMIEKIIWRDHLYAGSSYLVELTNSNGIQAKINNNIENSFIKAADDTDEELDEIIERNFNPRYLKISTFEDFSSELALRLVEPGKEVENIPVVYDITVMTPENQALLINFFDSTLFTFPNVAETVRIMILHSPNVTFNIENKNIEVIKFAK